MTLLLYSNRQEVLLRPDNLPQVEGLIMGGLEDSIGSVVHQRHSQSGKGTHTTEAIIFFSKILRKIYDLVQRTNLFFFLSLTGFLKAHIQDSSARG